VDYDLASLLDQQQRMLFDDGIWRDSVRQMIYSSAGFPKTATTIPSATPFFGYSRGQPVPGSGNASGYPSTLWHTNLEQGGILESPKNFRCDAVRVYMPALSFDAGVGAPDKSDPTSATAASAPQRQDLLEDWLMLYYSCALQLTIGTKDYVNHPLWLLPANIGWSGLADVASDNASATLAAELNVQLPNSVGVDMRFRVAPFLIGRAPGYEVRTIRGAIVCPWATPPTLRQTRTVTVAMFGNYMRGVQ